MVGAGGGWDGGGGWGMKVVSGAQASWQSIYHRNARIQTPIQLRQLLATQRPSERP